MYNDNEIQRLIQLAQKTQWNFKLNQYEDAALIEINKSLTRAKREIGAELRNIGPLMDKWERERLELLADHLQMMTVATQAQITGDITAVAATAGSASYAKHSDILSFDDMVPNFNALSLSASQLESMVSKTPIGGKLLNEWVERSFESNVKDVFKSEVMTGLLKGEGYKPLVKRFNIKAFKGLERDIETLTRSYVQTINVQAMQDVAEANEDIIKGKKWSSATENGSAATGRGICRRCLSMDSKDEVYPLKGGPPMPLHPNCLIGETPVFSPDMSGAFVATYDGPIVDIGITDGRRLSVSPQHMFLTPQGFISAELLTEGDKIFDSTISKRAIGRAPYDDNSPSLIKNIVRSLAESSGMTTKSMPCAPEYLHGDGGFCNGHVDIITPDSFLRDDVNPSFDEFITKVKFNNRDVRMVGLSGLRNFASLLFSMRDTTDGGVGIRRVSPVFLGRASGHHKAVGGSLAPNRDIVFNKSFSDGTSRYSEGFSNGVFGFTGQIPLANFFNRKIQNQSIGFDPISFDDIDNGLFCFPIGITDVLDRHPGQIELADVLFVKKRYFSGHVYDLQSFSSLYTANGLVSGNCRCVWEYETKTFREMGIDIDELKEAHRPATVRGFVDPETGKLYPQRVGTGGRKIVSTERYLGRYEDWLKTQPTAIQIQTLGPGRYEVWKAGTPLGGMTDSKGNLKLLTELPKVN